MVGLGLTADGGAVGLTLVADVSPVGVGLVRGEGSLGRGTAVGAGVSATFLWNRPIARHPVRVDAPSNRRAKDVSIVCVIGLRCIIIVLEVFLVINPITR